ncbi:hypothetical protein MKZ38_007051 [Zalerion maritima]|uniref:Uncharacterized protein n=1 Tax=Zalerion maritima TaxID=339359 RepID=A0AAD5WW33_9PEZI|nr:hypothetical protein MKZ38_007051 [Zalerion maritima]
MYRPWILISPSSRGIGFALTRRVLLTTNAPVVATARKNLDEVKAEILHGLRDGKDADAVGRRLEVLKLDFLAASRCAEKFPSSEGHHLHLAMTVPGILRAEKSPSQISADGALETFRVNTLGPMLAMKHFHGFLPAKRTAMFPRGGKIRDEDGDGDAGGKNKEEGATARMKGLDPRHATWATMSARVGSISDNKLGGWYSYRSSKAAVNQLVRTFDLYLRNRAGGQAVCVGLHPGTVKTEFTSDYWASTREGKLFTPEFSAERLVDLCCGRRVGGQSVSVLPEGRGKCWDWDGKEILP